MKLSLMGKILAGVAATSLMGLPQDYASAQTPTSQAPSSQTTAAHHRVIILTDIGADPDDEMSLIRLLLYSNEIDIKAIIATTSTWQRNNLRPELITRILDGYGQVLPNLLLHDQAYPQKAALQAIVYNGVPTYGQGAIGQGDNISAGARAIINEAQRGTDPLWISVWGGVNTLAEALNWIEHHKTRAELDAIIARLRVYTISDQDDSGPWLRNHYPNLFFIVSPGPYGASVWTGINGTIEGFDNNDISNHWLASNIQQGHGPLGALYPDVAYGMEGDTPSFLSLIPNGLNEPNQPNLGGWGGRYVLRRPNVADYDPNHEGAGGVETIPETRPIWTNSPDRYSPTTQGAYNYAWTTSAQVFEGPRVTLFRWRHAFQNDFAARMDWTVNDFAHANHPPIARVNTNAITVKGGDWVELSADGSSDPDGDSLSYRWYQYREAGTLAADIGLNAVVNTRRTGFAAPRVSHPATAEVILEVTDKGTPALTRYQRVHINIQP